jgi:hypothetical protein
VIAAIIIGVVILFVTLVFAPWAGVIGVGVGLALAAVAIAVFALRRTGEVGREGEAVAQDRREADTSATASTGSTVK